MRIYFLSLAIAMVCTGVNYSFAQEIEGTWNGVITVERKFKGVAGSHEIHVQFNIANTVVTGNKP